MPLNTVDILFLPGLLCDAELWAGQVAVFDPVLGTAPCLTISF